MTFFVLIFSILICIVHCTDPELNCYITCDEQIGNKVKDFSSAGNDGTLENSASVVTGQKKFGTGSCKFGDQSSSRIAMRKLY